VSYVIIASIVLGIGAAGHSYILPAKQILGFMIEQVGSARGLKISQNTVIYDPDLEDGMTELDETLYYRYPSRFRREGGALGVEQVRVASPEGAMLVTNGKIITEEESPLDHFKDLLLYRETESLVERLSALDVDIDVVSLGRYNETIAYVIGARYPDESVPQVWIEKNTFRPLRYIVKGGDSEDSVVEEIEYADYIAVDKKRRYPARIQFFQNGRLTMMYVLKTFKINPDLPDELFDIAYLKTVYQPIASIESPSEPVSEIDEVEKTIRDFRKTFE
jgi:outer membrane lipoprotein-sorting protein